MAMLYCQKERIAEKGGVSLLPQPELQGGYIGALREVVVLHQQIVENHVLEYHGLRKW